VLEFSIAVGTAESTGVLDLAPKSGVLTIRRLRFAGGEPLAIMTNELPADIAPDYSALGTSGLYASLSEKGNHHRRRDAADRRTGRHACRG